MLPLASELKFNQISFILIFSKTGKRQLFLQLLSESLTDLSRKEGSKEGRTLS